ncbi:hypothetical protein ACSBOB_16065 [Mesorhizobium sp. ASY16-5R]|uniref:hypothetical protein n=1 Tax=Mesorhizobium sp. ASY16-5R TaxID=3445772 RepID=UPI003FA007EC
MLDSTSWMLLTIAGPVLLAAAMAYALIKQRKLTPAERSELREAVGELYADTEENDQCPVRVDTEKRRRETDTRSRRFDRLAGTTR